MKKTLKRKHFSESPLKITWKKQNSFWNRGSTSTSVCVRVCVCVCVCVCACVCVSVSVCVFSFRTSRSSGWMDQRWCTVTGWKVTPTSTALSQSAWRCSAWVRLRHMSTQWPLWWLRPLVRQVQFPPVILCAIFHPLSSLSSSFPAT